VLFRGRDAEASEHDHEHEQVVDGETLLHQIRRHKILPVSRAKLEGDPASEDERGQDPDDTPDDR
jgi:hypothetical protein